MEAFILRWVNNALRRIRRYVQSNNSLEKITLRMCGWREGFNSLPLHLSSYAVSLIE